MKKNRELKIILFLLMTGLLLHLVIATSWTQYLPAPTTNTINRTLSLSNGYAFAYTNGGTNFLLFNRTAWLEITKPSSSIVNTSFNFISADKIGGYVYIAYTNSGSDETKVIRYNPLLNIYNNETQTTGITSNSFECDEDNSKCYAMSSTRFYEVYPSIINTTSLSSGTLIRSNGDIWGRTTSLNKWTGVGWTSYTLSSSTLLLSEVKKYDYARAVVGVNGVYSSFLWARYNVTSNTWLPTSAEFVATGGATRYSSDTKFWITAQSGGVYQIKKCGYYEEPPCTNDTITIGRLTTMDYDDNTGIAWAGGSNGEIWEYNESSMSGIITYIVKAEINPNPTIYARPVTFYCTATSSSGADSDLNFTIWNSNYTTKLFETTQSNIPSGTKLDISDLILNDPFWTTYPVNNYGIECYGVSNTLTTTSEDYDLLIWNVTSGEMINQTNYDTEQFYYPMSLYYRGLNSVSASDESNAFGVIEKINKTGCGSDRCLYLASFESSNAWNMVVDIRNETMLDLGGLNPSVVYSVSDYNNSLFVGTDKSLWTFNNTLNRTANDLIYNNIGVVDSGIFPDLTSINQNQAWTCQDGKSIFDDDDAYLFNKSVSDFGNKININPCLSLLYYNNYLFVHTGNNIRIYNNTQDYEQTISFSSSNVYATHDLIDVLNNNLFFIGTYNPLGSVIYKYDISDVVNPVFIARCTIPNSDNMNYITSLEAINQYEVMIAGYNSTTGATAIFICDFNNNDTFKSSLSYYEAQYSHAGMYGIIHEIQAMNSNRTKFHTAEDTAYGIYNYEKTISSIDINHAPTINEITNTNSNPCINETIELEIMASDPDTSDYLSYGLSCNGGTTDYYTLNNRLSCTYTTTGTKYITAFAKDNHNSQDSNTFTISIQNCTANYTLRFKVMDYNTLNPLPDVLVETSNNSIVIGSDTTDSNGYADIIVPSNIFYTNKFSLDNYASITQGYSPSSLRYDIYIRRISANITGGNTGVLIVDVYDTSLNSISDALVSTFDPVSAETKFGLTDPTGEVYLFDVYASNRFVVTAKKENYPQTSTYTSLTRGEIKKINITLTGTLGIGEYEVTARECQDAIKGVLLCGNLSITGIGSNCMNDTQCISGDCFKNLGASNGTCSSFNWSVCDRDHLGRGNGCFLTKMGEGLLGNIGKFMLNRFWWLLIIIILVAFIVILRRRK